MVLNNAKFYYIILSLLATFKTTNYSRLSFYKMNILYYVKLYYAISYYIPYNMRLYQIIRLKLNYII